VQLTQAELDEMLRRAVEARRKLRRATRELQALGEVLLRGRTPSEPMPGGEPAEPKQEEK
jgi:hypothetical protein